MPKGFTSIGRITRVVGLKGELKVSLENTWEGLDKIEAFFIFSSGEAEPFQVEWSSVERKTLRVRFFSVNSRTEAEKLKGQEIFVPREVAPGFKRPWEFLIGLSAYDHKNMLIGVVEDVLEYPGQHLARVRHGDKTKLIPLREEFIRNRDDQKVVFDLPEGLLDI